MKSQKDICRDTNDDKQCKLRMCDECESVVHGALGVSCVYGNII